MSRRLILFLGLTTLMAPVFVRADSAETALKNSSPFKSFTLSQVADGKILESREGASLAPQIAAVQTCFIFKAPLETVAARILNWNPAGKPGLKASKHLPLPSSVTPGAFEGTLATIFKSSGDDSWIAKQSEKAKDSSCELLLTPEEKSQLAAVSSPAKLITTWATLLANRFNGFRSHGAPDFESLISNLKKLGVGDISGPSGSAHYYWETGRVSDRESFSEGVSWSNSSSGSTRIIDGEFFVTSEYTASLDISTLWPVSVNGKPATLVWRIDSAFSNQFTDLGGVERIAAAGMLLSSSKKAIEALRQGDK